MGKIDGFREFDRKVEQEVAVESRIKSFDEFTLKMKETELTKQGSRCMDCGIPFCHSACPLGNLIPDFNHMVHQKEWQKAAWILHSTNNFPEFTGRLCPAPCEKSCVLGINSDPVAIETLEKNIVEKAFENGWIKAQKPSTVSGKSVAVVGSGPSGLAAAQQLNRAGHKVVVYEKAEKAGGLLRYGIPNFKLDKSIIDRRLAILEEEGIEFKFNANVGENISKKEMDSFDAVLLCGGAEKSRDLPNLKSGQGIHQAMDFLTEQTKALEQKRTKLSIDAKGKNVIVIGGGDTGSDCIGTANRQNAASVTSFEIMPKAPKDRSPSTPWPFWPLQFKESSSHREGCDQNWLISAKSAIRDKNGTLTALETVKVEWILNNGKRELKEIEGSQQIWPCDMVFLALGFTGPQKILSETFDIPTNARGNYVTENYRVGETKVFSAGDMRRGQSLIVWAIAEGREAAKSIDSYLMNKSDLSSKGKGDLLSA